LSHNLLFYSTETYLADLIDEILTLYYSTQDNVQKILKTHYSKTDRVKVHKSRFTFVIVNLIQNALDAMSKIEPSRREISISVYQEGAKVYVTVADTGCGIAQEDLIKIFSQGYSTKRNGFGFELNSCANYTGEMNGKIAVSTQGIGKGAEFKISFPTKRR